MRQSAREIALGKWPGILVALGVDANTLVNKPHACPICGGKDRFRFDDKEGRGTFYCNQCKPSAGDGYDFLVRLKGWDFKTAVREVERVVGTVSATPLKPTCSEADQLKAMKRLTQVWEDSEPLTAGDEAMKYFANRGLHPDLPMPALRVHPGLRYYDDKNSTGQFTALIARMVDANGGSATLQRTYLKDGHKAPVGQPRKLMTGKPFVGGAIRLFEVGECLGIAEGIETALAARQLFSVPVWACYSAGNLEKFVPPDAVRKLIVFGDNDEKGTGQAAAWSVAKRLRLRGLDVEVKIPEQTGDWNDVLLAEGGK